MEKLEHFRHILLFQLNRGAKAAEVARNICTLYRDSVIGDSTAIKFSRFMVDRFDISGSLRPEIPSGFDEDRLNTLIHNDPCKCTRELTNVMNCDIPPSRDIFIQWARFKNRVYGHRML